MPEILSATVYNPSTSLGVQHIQDAVLPLADRHALHTPGVDTEDEGTIPRYYFTPRYSTASTYMPAAISPRTIEDFPTPKARGFNMSKQAGQPSPCLDTFPADAMVQSDSDFDSLYDVTDDEAEVPLKCSASVKKTARSVHSRYPSVVIPSPSTWPTIEKLRSAQNAAPPTPPTLLTPSRQALSMIQSHNLLVPARSTTPSLDGSLTSEEMDKLSCPSTPDTHKRRSNLNVDEWGPVQLDLQALQTLQHLSSMDFGIEQQEQNHRQGEMQEVARPSLNLSIPSAQLPSTCGNTPISALSVPSPGGFFSSLKLSARHTWSIPKKEESAPNTSTAEHFYGVPWGNRRKTLGQSIIKEQTATLAGSTLDGFSDSGMPTARPVIQDDEEAFEVKEINPSKTIFQYNEKYDAEVQKLSTLNLERTSHWLEEQDELQAALRDMSSIASPSSPSGSHSRGSSLDKSTKKSVTFAEEPQKSQAEPGSPKQTTTYIQGFEFIRNQSRKQDPYIHRQTRAEAMHLRRRCMPQAHRDQLLGKFELTDPVRPSPPRPVSEFYMNDPTVLKERIARAQSERQALDQMLPSTWVLQAQKQLNGGKLLSKPAARLISRAREPRILDVGGIPTNDWAWQVAYDYTYATVTTIYTAGANLTSNVSGPENHKHMTVPNLWTFPFPSEHFDVISARTLYELLKTDKPLGRSKDEYDLCIKECFRVLKTGGIIDFSLIDSDIIQAGSSAQAKSVEFGFNLKTRGYDAAPTKAFLPRLHKAGFKDVQRMWMVLPMGRTSANWKDVLPVGANNNEQERSIGPDGQVQVSEAPVFGSTADAAMMTGIVGSWLWEKWMLRLQVEMGKEDEKLLEGVVQVLEEGVREGSGWSFFKTLVDHEITVELKNEVCIRGTLKSVDQYLNIKLDNAEATDEARWPHLCSTRDMFIRGSVVRYVHLPGGAVDTTLLEDATRREAEAAKNKAK
ncbi:hypothetical protein BU24DRAFT_414337 [Aaosphaeria arxii CBS 175.79]|uniref:Sm domain-containing protein n=1 Tax=Aaosphaeria arxii CBS 175.79 TaxID=1450172 RepID=A0A6A5XAE5_9PLEO|nr:uncharacterized protein BU24DRAFT_414337 [Aaosphaeria arxii CBS 175.79]KAF2009883.1 hypothetical protein BU24DRAFT_414337 [Aaosphaeria arxii CBS 175.79]